MIPLVGLSNLFFIRYETSDQNRVTPTPAANHFPFPNYRRQDDPLYAYCSHAHLVYCFLLSVLDLHRSIMCTQRGTQNLRGSKELKNLHPSMWIYFQFRVADRADDIGRHWQPRKVSKVYVDRKLAYYRCPQETIPQSAFRFETKDEFDLSRKIFGISFGLGVEKRRPTEKHPKDDINANDALNLIVYREEGEASTSEISSCDGVDFIYENMTQRFKLVLKISRIMAVSREEIIDLRKDLAHTCGVLDTSSTLEINHAEIIGETFTNDMCKLTVLRVNGDNLLSRVDAIAQSRSNQANRREVGMVLPFLVEQYYKSKGLQMPSVEST